METEMLISDSIVASVTLRQLGSGLIAQSQKATAAAMQIAEK
jgi:hypothetical protein